MIFFLIGIFLMPSSIFALKGEHVCPHEESTKVYVTKTILKTVKVRHYKWCANVPPRCSYYTDEEKWIPETVEEDHFSTIDRCCPGYKEDDNREHCVFSCDRSTCINGNCNGENECLCRAGFRGESCEEECPDGYWGENCLNRCGNNCHKCDSRSGKCTTCPEGSDEDCNYEMEYKATTPVFFNKKFMNTPWFQKYYTFATNLQKSTESYKEPQVTTTMSNNEDVSTITEAKPKEDYQKPSPTEGKTLLIKKLEQTTQSTENFDDDDKNNNINLQQYEITPYFSQKLNEKLLVTTLPAYNIDQKEVTTIKMNEYIIKKSENPSSEPFFVGLHPTPLNRIDFIFVIGAIVGIIVTIIVITIVILATKRTKRKLGKNTTITSVTTARIRENNNERTDRSLSIHSRKSVIHTPLPDPPIFGNPMYSPTENAESDLGGNFDTHIICSMSFTAPCNYIRDSQIVDEFYDHPPSTGSYRAAPIPEPPQEMFDKTTISVKEPLYDEIPSWRSPLPVYKNSTFKPQL